MLLNISWFWLTRLRISCGRTRQLARENDRQLQPFDGRRRVPVRKWMGTRSHDATARNVCGINDCLGPHKT